MTYSKRVIVPSILAVFVLLDTADAATLLTNGNFEGGIYSNTVGAYANNNVPTGWTPNSQFVQYPSTNGVSAVNPYSGSYALQLGNATNNQIYGPSVSQTISDTARTVYLINFEVASTLGGNLLVEGCGIGVVCSSATASWDQTFGVASGGTYAMQTVAFSATGSDTLTFMSTYGSTLFLDDVSINPVNASPSVTPLPPTWTMMLIGLAGFGFVAYRRKSKPALVA